MDKMTIGEFVALIVRANETANIITKKVDKAPDDVIVITKACAGEMAKTIKELVDFIGSVEMG